MVATGSRKRWFWAAQCLSISRVCLMFLFVIFCPFPSMWRVSATLYLIAWLTDFFDGRLARSKKVVSLFGDAMDVFGDRYATVISCLYVGFRGVHFVPLALILVRELFSVAVRMVRIESRPAMVQNHTVGGIVHSIIAGGTLMLVINPEAETNLCFSLPFLAVAAFYVIYFPITVYRSRHNLWQAITGDLEAT